MENTEIVDDFSAFFEEHPAKQEATTATAIATANILLTIFIKKTSVYIE